MNLIIDGRAPSAPAAQPAAGQLAAGQLAPVRKLAAGWYATTDGAWEIRHVDHDGAPVPWAALLKATGQGIYRPTLRECQAAIATGEALGEIATLDAAAMAQPCRGCGAPAAGLIDTTAGAQPICAGCTPHATAAGRTVRQPAPSRCLICHQPAEGAECSRCHTAHDHAVARSTDI